MSIDAIEARIAALDPVPPAPVSNASADFGTSLSEAQSADGAASPRYSDGASGAQSEDDVGVAQLRAAAAYDREPVAPQAMTPLIERTAVAGGVDPALVLAIAANESGFDPGATSPTGAMGVMQLMPQTAQAVGVNDPYDAAQNVAGGTQYLHAMLDRFGGSIPLAVAAYNAGPGAVERYGGIPPFPETQRYVANVMASYARWRG